MEKKIPIIVVVGPTASGKTRLSVDLAKHFNGEIISADSMQIYKYMDIATAKVTKEEMNGIKHHIIDFLEPSDSYSVASFVNDAAIAAQEIASRGKIPVIAGGTGLYVSSLIDGVSFSEDAGDTALREELYAFAQDNGAEALHQKLIDIDPQEAMAIHPNNIVRVVRAIEMFYTTGKQKSQHIAVSKLKPSIFDPVIIGLSCLDRENIYKRIDQRVDIMLENGLLEEAKRVLEMDYGLTASNAIGYKELIPYFEGVAPLEDCIDTLKRNTKRYAKRQLTWFKRNKSTNWIFTDQYDSYNEMLFEAIKIAEKGLSETEGKHE